MRPVLRVRGCACPPSTGGGRHAVAVVSLVVARSCANQRTAGGRKGSTGSATPRRVALLLACVNRRAR